MQNEHICTAYVNFSTMAKVVASDTNQITNINIYTMNANISLRATIL